MYHQNLENMFRTKIFVDQNKELSKMGITNVDNTELTIKVTVFSSIIPWTQNTKILNWNPSNAGSIYRRAISRNNALNITETADRSSELLPSPSVIHYRLLPTGLEEIVKF